mgnify:CR=1 FL=1|jgi:hypothetical protein
MRKLLAPVALLAGIASLIAPTLKTARLKVPTTGAAGWVNVSRFDVNGSQGAGGCPGAGMLTYKDTCLGATLTVR